MQINLSYWVALGASLSLAACGSDTADSGTPAGTVAGKSFAIKDGAAFITSTTLIVDEETDQQQTNHWLTIVLGDNTGVCSQVQRGATKAGSAQLVFALTRPGVPVTTGTYRLVGPNDNPSEAEMEAGVLSGAGAAAYDGSCTVDAGVPAPTTGNVVLTSVAGGHVKGSFDLQFPNGGRLAGSFDVATCTIANVDAVFDRKTCEQ
jgi:hypothetical protein